MNINKCVADGIVTPKEPCTITPSLACGEIVTNPDPTLGKTKYNLAAEAITTLNNEINSGSLSEAALEEALIAKTYHINEQEQARGNVIWSYNTWETLDSTVNAVDSIITFLSADGCLANKKLLVGTLYGAARYSLASPSLK